MEYKFNHPAVVMGLPETGLEVGRSLGKIGISVFGISYSKSIAFHSKYINGVMMPHPIRNENEFKDHILKFIQKFDHKPVAFFAADEYLTFYNRNEAFIKENFLTNLPPASLIKSISDKYEFYKLVKGNGISLPKTIFIETKEQIEQNIESLRYPVFIKGRDVNDWRNKISGSLKGFVVNDKHEFKAKLTDLLDMDVSIIAQEQIMSSDKHNFKSCVYISKRGELLLNFTLAKIHQYPIHFGIGSAVKSIEYPELLNLGEKLFKSINYTGVGSAEFKFDERDNELKLIEINTRYWQQNALADFCGYNFPFVDYLESTNQRQIIPDKFDIDKVWINPLLNYKSLLQYRKKNELTIRDWIDDLKGEKIVSYYRKGDMLPFYFHLKKAFMDFLVMINRKLFR